MIPVFVNRVDIDAISADEWATMIAAAVKLGARDATLGDPERTGDDIAAQWALEWRGTHAKALRQAYLAGRRHVEAMANGN